MILVMIIGTILLLIALVVGLVVIGKVFYRGLKASTKDE